MELGFKTKILTLVIITVILYFGLIIAYEHPMGGLTGLSSGNSTNSSLSDVTSFVVLSFILIGIFAVAWRRHRAFSKKRKA